MVRAVVLGLLLTGLGRNFNIKYKVRCMITEVIHSLNQSITHLIYKALVLMELIHSIRERNRSTDDEQVNKHGINNVE